MEIPDYVFYSITEKMVLLAWCILKQGIVIVINSAVFVFLCVVNTLVCNK